jgi:cell division protein FtsW
MWGLSLVPPDKIINKVGMGLFIFFFILMAIMPVLPSSLVTASGGANRWIRLPGFSLSPVEFFKIGFIYFLSWSFHRRLIEAPKKIKLKDEFKLLAPYFLTFFVVVFIIAFMQKDLGQVVLLGVILFILLIFANRSYKVFVTLGVGGLVAFIGLILAAPHRIQRIYSWWAMVQDKILSILPTWADNYLRIDELPEPYQVSHSLNAIYNGGIVGQGISSGNIKLGFLSEVHTDFVLAGIAEDIGIALTIIIAFLINSYGISGMIPIKGIAVPFLSYGGSSMLAMSLAIGLVLSISKSVDLNKKVK